MQKLRAVRSGQHVIVRDEPWLVVQNEAFQEASLVTLRGVSAENLGETLRVLAPFDTVHAGQTRAPIRRGTRREALTAAAAAIAEATPWSDTWTAASARIDLRPWQLEPALAVIHGATRVLLADAVGLGKTIQALLIVTELVARGMARRVLVLTPASLRDQWAGEASQRFGLTATVFDHATLAASASMLPIGINPWSTAALIVSSIDLVKRGDVRSSLDAVAFDVLIVDEAHHLTPATDRAAVVADLAARTPWLVLLSATPHTGDDAAFRFLCGLGDVEGEGAITAFRRLSEHVQVTLGLRRQTSIAVSTTAAERALLDETLAYAKAVWGRSADAPGAALVASVIARRAASCALAAQRTVERRLALLSATEPPQAQPVLPWDEGDDDDGAGDAALAIAGLDDRSREIAWLEQLARLSAAASAQSSKVAVIRRLLRRTGEPLIVFSEYRDVVRTVAAQLVDLSTVAVLHGGLSAPERRYQLAAFTQGRARTLVTTDAAGEGLNLQARCRLVVNFELPWNPLRLEQRIGRVDRIGQRRRVHAIQLFHRDSFESIVATRFDERRSRVAAASPAMQAVPPDRVAAAVFGGFPLDISSDVGSFPRLCRVAEADGELAIRSRRLGTLARSKTAALSVRTICAEGVGATRETRAVFVFANDVVDGAHRLIERHATALRVEFQPEVVDHRRFTTHDLARLTSDRRVRAALAAHVALELGNLKPALGHTAENYARRINALLRAIEGQRTSRPIQTSLFDRREEQRSQLRDAAVQGWVRNLQRHADSAAAMRTIASTAPHLVAAWIE